MLLLRGHILSPVLRLLHLCRLLAGGAPAPGRGRRLGVPFSRSVPFRLSRGFVVRFCFRLSLGTEIGRGIKCLAIAGFFSRFQVSLGTGIRVGGFHVSLGGKGFLARLRLAIRVPFRVSLGRCCLAIGIVARFQVGLGRVGIQALDSRQLQVRHTGIGHLAGRRILLSLGDGIRLSPGGFLLRIGSLFLNLFLGSCHGMGSSFG